LGATAADNLAAICRRTFNRRTLRWRFIFMKAPDVRPPRAEDRDRVKWSKETIFFDNPPPLRRRFVHESIARPQPPLHLSLACRGRGFLPFDAR
jgi:hypothetical protein